MKRVHGKLPFKDEFVIYYSKTDKSWIAHSLCTDQLGYGDCVVNAIVDLLIGTKNLLDLHAKDPDVEIYRQAPERIKRYGKRAKRLPEVLWEVACERYENKLIYPVCASVPQSHYLKHSSEMQFA
jgi:hypothetical protein